RLLDDLGYGFALDQDLAGQPVTADTLYRLRPDAGLDAVFELQPGVFYGADLLAMAQADWSAPGALAAAKRLMRQALAPHLGGRPQVSRELFLSAPRINLKDSLRD
ncbi:MAG: DNA repair protein RecO, partial [Pseudomonas sp.]